MKIGIAELIEDFEDLEGCEIREALIRGEAETGENVFEVVPAEKDSSGHYTSSDGDVWDEEVEAAMRKGELVFSIGDIEHRYIYGFIKARNEE